VILSDVHAQPVVALERSGLYDELTEDNIHGNIDDALNRARKYLGSKLWGARVCDAHRGPRVEGPLAPLHRPAPVCVHRRAAWSCTSPRSNCR